MKRPCIKVRSTQSFLYFCLFWVSFELASEGASSLHACRAALHVQHACAPACSGHQLSPRPRTCRCDWGEQQIVGACTLEDGTVPSYHQESPGDILRPHLRHDIPFGAAAERRWHREIP